MLDMTDDASSGHDSAVVQFFDGSQHSFPPSKSTDESMGHVLLEETVVFP
jgi:hypothetical protein